MEHIAFNLLYRWFVGLRMDAEVWDHSTFSANRDRLLNERISRLFFERVLALAEWKKLISYWDCLEETLNIPGFYSIL